MAGVANFIKKHRNLNFSHSPPFLLLILFLLLAGCARISPQKETGKYPERIISLAPSITEQLYLLGLQDRLIGVTIYCEYPPEAKKKEKIGTLLHPSIEKITALNPDLILATQDGNRPEVISRLASLGLNVFTFDPCENFEGIWRNFMLLGSLTNKEKEAKRILVKVESKIEKIKERIKGISQVKVFWQVGARPLVSVAKGTFADEIIRFAGGINIAHEASSRYPRYSLEEVLRQNPEVIILVTMGDVTQQEIKVWKNFSALKAAKNDRIYVIDADLVCRATPVRFQEAVKEVAYLLHPEVFAKK